MDKSNKKRKLEGGIEKQAKKAKIQLQPLYSMKAPTQEEVNEFLELLCGDIGSEKFFEDSWQDRHVVLSKDAKKLVQKLSVRSLNFKELCQNAQLIGKEDIQLTRYDDEASNVLLLLERGIVPWEVIAEAINEGWSAKLFKPYLIFPQLAQIYYLFSEVWKATEEVKMEVTFSPPKTAPTAPAADGCDKFIVQVEGTQIISVYRLPEQEEVDSDEPLQFVPDELESYHVEDVKLEPGYLFYVPGKYVIFRKQEETSTTSSLDISMYLPPQPTWRTWIELSLFMAEKTLEEKDDRFIPHTVLSKKSGSKEGNSSFDRIKDKALQVVKKLPDYTEAVNKRLSFQSKYNKLHFEVGDWLSKYNFLEEIEKNGFVKIKNLLPDVVADRLLEVVTSLHEDQWISTEAEENTRYNNIEHKFFSAKNFPYHDSVFSIFRRLVADQESTLSVAKYTKGHFINPHEDVASKIVDDVLYDRDIALVYYLSKGWKKENGGIFVDLNVEDKPVEIMPEFNTLIAFKVPRKHKVTEVVSNDPRYSIFGWFLKPNGEMEGDSAEQDDEGSEDSEP